MVKVKMISFFNENLSKNHSHNHPQNPHSTPPYSHSQTEPSTTNKQLTGTVLSLKLFEREVIQHKLYIY